MSWFDDIFGQSKKNQKNENNENNDNEKISFDNDSEDEPINDEVYRRPKGKFRFPIQMEYDQVDDHNQEDGHRENNNHETSYHDNRFYDESEQSFSTNRRRRRRKSHDRNQQESTKADPYEYKGNNKSRYQQPNDYKPSHKTKSSYSKNENDLFEERISSLHQPKFKASEVPSAIFGMRKQKDVPNSGLRDHSISDNTDTTQDQSKDIEDTSENTKQKSSEVQKDVPTYSKTDNTINIENIYASQIVSEIRKEREKKLLKKKQFEQALKEKRESELKSLESEEEKSQIKNQDYFFKQQASYIKNKSHSDDVNDESDIDEVDDLNIAEEENNHIGETVGEAIEVEDNQIHASLQPDVNDLTSYKYEEIDLDFEDEENNSNDIENKDDIEEIDDIEIKDTEQADFNQEEEDVQPQFEEVAEDEIKNPLESTEEIGESEQYVDDDISFEEEPEDDIGSIEEAEDLESEYAFSDDAISEETVEELEEVQEEAEVKEEIVSDNPIVEDEEIVSDEVEEPEEVEVEEPEEVEVEEPEEVEVEEPEEVEEVESKPSLEPVLSPNKKRTSPFNVVMTPSDKRNYQSFMKNDANKPKEAAQVNTEHTQATNEPDEPETPTKRKGPLFVLPPVSILDDVVEEEDNTEWLEEKKKELDEAFYHFNVPAQVVNMIQGPTVTRFELSVEKGVKVSRITALQDDIKMALAAKDIRIEAPIPGTSLVGIEVPNQSPKKIPLGQMITSQPFQQAESKLTVAMGFKINNEPLLMDIAKTPHALIAGATGSGKSVCINAILTSLLYKNHPDELKLLLIDPKMVELAPYNDLPHLVAPVITDVKAATQSLKWAVEEMERRYKRFAELHVRNITAFNKKANYDQRMAKIVIVIDELADLMMMSPQEVEQSIARIAQKARACGIHMILATQRPSVNVITGLIKANVPTRISFMVSSSIDSRTILDVGGAEKLLGNGDMLYLGNGMNKPIRVQGAFVSDDEIDETVSNVSNQMKPNYLFKEESLLKKVNEQPADALFDEVCEFMVKEGNISTSLIQRHFQIGYNRAARMIDNLEERGYISGPNGSKPRDVLLTKDILEDNETNI
nr:DNA translocase FtsK [Mammaliicoccus sp. Marseille-Q6498]